MIFISESLPNWDILWSTQLLALLLPKLGRGSPGAFCLEKDTGLLHPTTQQVVWVMLPGWPECF